MRLTLALALILTLALTLILTLTPTLILTRTSCAFGGVMGGCVFGNVSSPLGDTAVLSAMVRGDN